MKKKYLLLIGFLLNSSFLFSQVGINTDGSNPDPSAILDAKSTEKGFLPPRMTLAEMNAIASPASGLMVCCTDCGPNGSGTLMMFANGVWFIFNASCLAPGSPVNGVHIPSSNQIIWNWNTVAPAAGYKWNTVNDYNTATDMFAATTQTETGLSCSSPYTRYVWAYNACGISTATSLTQTTSACNICGASITINHAAGEVAPVTKTVTYGTVTNIPGETSKCWITSNLGADHQASAYNDATEASAGWYWQFDLKQGYKHDGTTRTPNTPWKDGIYENSDWISANDPCAIELGTGWRIPTKAEWTNVIASGGWTNWNGSWNSNLKMHVAGELNGTNGALDYRGSIGYYWSSTQGDAAIGWGLAFSMNYSGMYYSNKPYCFPLRCVRDTDCLPPGSAGTGVHIPSSDQIIWNWNSVSGATGYKWSATNNYAAATNMETATTKTETGLACLTAYTRYVWAYNACGISAATTLTQTTSACFTCSSSITINHAAGAVAPVSKTVTYGTVTNIPGETSKCWITSNLGADHQATAVDDATEASAGWYWQFNRKQGYKHDGTTRTPNTAWINYINVNLDWQTVNDPCAIELGSGWRIPTKAEWTNVDAGENWTNWNGPWNSLLKMHAAGDLNTSDGSLLHRGSIGRFWSSTQNDANNGWGLHFLNSFCSMVSLNKAYGFTARCVRDADCLPPVSPVTGVHIPSSDQIIWNWNAVAGATGYKWSATNNYATAIDMGTATTKTETGLTTGTTYTRYVWAYNTCGISTSTTLTAQTVTFVIGQSYGGGIIFYIDGTGLHGLIAATSDQSSGAQWGCYGTTIGGTSTAIGTGQANTTAIVNGCNTAGIAARICNDLVLNGYDDWFLPSKDELNQMYVQKGAIGGFTSNAFWSSSEYFAILSWPQDFASGAQFLNDKFNNYHVRAVRAF